MPNETLIESVTNESIDTPGGRFEARPVASDDFSDSGSGDESPSGDKHEEDAQRIQSLIAILQHAYVRLLSGDTNDARAALERALVSEGSDSLPIGGVSTPQTHPSQPVRHGTSVERYAYSNKDLEAIKPPIVIRTLGTFEVLVNGETPGAKRKPPHLLLGILKVLIANGGCSVNRSLLIDALWPDLDGDRANDAQQVALHRLRRLLGHSDALVINHGYISINPQLIEVDAFILDTLCRNPFITGRQHRASTALNLYRGTFLPDELDSPWSQRMRECMRAKFVNIIAAAGKELEASNDSAGAAALYEQALTVDDLENIIREGLVRVLRRQKAGKRRTRKKADSVSVQ
jgi:DNA-binding SARP family transcriptional activator